MPITPIISGVTSTGAGGTSLTLDFLQSGELSSSSVWMADTSSSIKNRNLPLNPQDDDEVVVKDYKGNASVNNITMGRNGQNIEGLAEDLVIDINYGSVHLKFATATGWFIIT